MFFTSSDIQRKMDEAGREREPFLFGIDFEMTEGFFFPNPLSSTGILFDISGVGNRMGYSTGANVGDRPGKSGCDGSVGYTTGANVGGRPGISGCAGGMDHIPRFEAEPEPLSTYKKRFQTVMNGLKRGDSYLTNLTIRTPIHTSLSLEEIFRYSRAPYKLSLPGRWACFSPECFVRINNGSITTYPMKGTIDSSLPNAREMILNDEKEAAEHNTIVDLLRNDLSRIATNVRVKRFRYTEEIKTHKGTLLQVSSEIAGTLPDNWRDRLGSLFFELLPAGSVSGAPKEATLQLIRIAEGAARGYYTGVAGYFDGERLESFVLIRFIEQEGTELFFRSGGGITARSICEKEYDEAIQKVYLPFPAL